VGPARVSSPQVDLDPLWPSKRYIYMFFMPSQYVSPPSAHSSGVTTGDAHNSLSVSSLAALDFTDFSIGRWSNLWPGDQGQSLPILNIPSGPGIQMSNFALR